MKVKESMPIVDKMVDDATAEIRKQTGWEDFPREYVLYDLADAEWIFGISVDDEDPEIDMGAVEMVLARIVRNNIEWFREEA